MVPRSILAAAVLAILIDVSPAGAAPLHEAAKNGQIDALKELLKGGADLQAQDAGGETPLTAAALAGQTDVVELLIDHGATVDGRNRNGFTALHAAAYGGHDETVQVLLDAGASIDDQENWVEATPLHLAAEENHLEVADLLLANGAALELEDVNHHTPASKATFRLNEEMVILLRLQGAGCQSEQLMSLRYRLYCLGRG